MRLFLAAVALAPLLACDLADAFTLAGDHVDVVIDPGLEPCGDLVGHMDRFVELVAARWDVDLAPVHYTYHWQTYANYLTSGCRLERAACAMPLDVYSYKAPLDHELVHLVSFSVGRPPAFFIEGAAMVFELRDELPMLDIVPGPEDVRVAMTARAPLSFERYNLGGAYTRFLIDRHGMPAYLDFYASLRGSADIDEIAATHADIFGEPLDDTIAAFDAGGRDCSLAAYNFKLVECGGPPLAWDGDVLTTHHDLSCAGDEAIGWFGLNDRSRVYANFVVEAPGLFELSLAASSVDVELASCGGCDAPPAISFRAGDGPRRVELAAGAYYLLMSGPLILDQAATVRLGRVSEPW